MIPKASHNSPQLRHDAQAWRKDSALAFAKPPRTVADDMTSQASVHAQQHAYYDDDYDTKSSAVDSKQRLSDYGKLPEGQKRGFDALVPALPASLTKLPYGRIAPKRLARERRIDALDLDLGPVARRTRTSGGSYNPDNLAGHNHYEFYSREGAEQVNGMLRLRTGSASNFGVYGATVSSGERRVPPTIEKIRESREEIVPAIDAHLNYARQHGQAFDGVTFRGVSSRNAEMLNVAGLRKGDIVREAGYYSTSTNLHIAKNDFAKQDGTLMYVAGRSGVRKPRVFPIKEEHEVLYPRETPFQVVKNTEFPDGKMIDGVRIKRIVVLKELTSEENTLPPVIQKSDRQTFLDYVFPKVAARRFDHEQQFGSTPGGFFELSSGERGYAKFYRDPKQAQIEAFADALYAHTATSVPKARLLTIDDRPALFTSLISGRPTTVEALRNDPRFHEHFALDAILANHDVLGTNVDNIIQGEDRQHYRLDNGSALMFRAQGGHKSVDDDSVPELLTMRDSRHGAGQVFSSLSDEDVAKQIYVLRDRFFRRADSYGRYDVLDMAAGVGFVGEEKQQIAGLFARRLTAAIKWADEVSAKAGSVKSDIAPPVVPEAAIPKADSTISNTTSPGRGTPEIPKASAPVEDTEERREITPPTSSSAPATSPNPGTSASKNSGKSDAQKIALYLALAGAAGLSGLGGYYLYANCYRKQTIPA